MTRSAYLALAALVGLAPVALSGCKDAFERLNCRTICENYKECEDSSIRLGDCTDDCFDAIDGHDDLEDDAYKCAHCVDGADNRTCAEAREDCTRCDTVYASFMGGASGK